MIVKVLDKRYAFREVSRLGVNEHTGEPKGGDVDPPDKQGKAIRVLSTLKGERRLDVIIHECLHAADWHRSEEWVSETASDLARILWRLGYRCE